MRVWTVFVVILFLIYIKWIWSRRKLYVLSMKLPGPYSLPLIGSIFFCINIYRTDVMSVILEGYKKYKGTYGFWLGLDYHIVALEPQALKVAFNKSIIGKPPKSLGSWKTAMGAGLLTLTAVNDDEFKWKWHKKILSSVFSASMAKQSYPHIQENCIHLQNILGEYCNNGLIDIAIYVQRFTSDIISEALFGVQLNFKNGNRDDLFDAVEIMAKSVFNRVIKVWYRCNQIYEYSELGKSQKRATDVLRKNSQEIYDTKIKQQDKLPINTANFVKSATDILLECRAKDLISEFDAVDEITNIWNAGSDTTALLMAHFFITMATHKRCQDIAFKELKEYYKNDPNAHITFEDINKFIYLDMCFKETARLVSPAPISLRYVTKDVRFKTEKYDFNVPPDTNFVVSSYCSQHLASNWKNPYEFIPERFNEVYDHLSFIPFSGGPRKCPGSVLAKLIMKAGMAHVLMKYELQSDWSYKDMPLMFDIGVRSKWGYKIFIKKRSWT